MSTLSAVITDYFFYFSSLFSTLQDQGPDIFVLDGRPDSSRGDVIRYVRKWNKFKELIIVLVKIIKSASEDAKGYHFQH
jgi:hypothetical protein